LELKLTGIYRQINGKNCFRETRPASSSAQGEHSLPAFEPSGSDLLVVALLARRLFSEEARTPRGRGKNLYFHFSERALKSGGVPTDRGYEVKNCNVNVK
jgi:hypothetical protein